MTTVTTKISRSRAGHVWVTVRSISMPEIVLRDLFGDLQEARKAAKGIAIEVETLVAKEQARLNAYAGPKTAIAQEPWPFTPT